MTNTQSNRFCGNCGHPVSLHDKLGCNFVKEERFNPFRDKHRVITICKCSKCEPVDAVESGMVN